MRCVCEHDFDHHLNNQCLCCNCDAFVILYDECIRCKEECNVGDLFFGVCPSCRTTPLKDFFGYVPTY